MTTTAPPAAPPAAAAASRLGGRPARTASSGCKGCGHPYALHGNGETPCQAFACTGGPDHTVCQGFIQAA